MPPNPWKLLKTEELTAQQRRDLTTALNKRKANLKKAMDKIENALVLLSKSLDQDSTPKYNQRLKAKAKSKATR